MGDSLNIADRLDEIDDLISEGEGLSMPLEREIPVQFITGPAGTGKTTMVMDLARQDPHYGVVSATTGVAAVNLGSITINSLLKYFDTASLQDAYINGALTRALADIVRDGHRNLIIDEVSMMDAEQLDIIYLAALQVAEYKSLKHPLGLIVVGDFCQLSPIKARWAFEADCWPRFEANTLRLDTFYRQTDPEFLKALTLARRGDPYAVPALQRVGVEFTGQFGKLIEDFPGTTILPQNKMVDRYNGLALSRVAGKPIRVRSERWGEQRSEWDLIPEQTDLKIGALVMVLANDTPAFTYANGDLGYIEGIELGQFLIKLIRTGQVVRVGLAERLALQREAPPGYSTPTSYLEAQEAEQDAKLVGEPYYAWGLRKWVMGGVKYYPLRLGYAITVHKSQGLTLDRVQIDIRGFFFGQPNMAYVALSRARTPGGLRIVGAPDLLARRINVAPEVLRWL